MKFTLISSQILPAKSIVANTKDRKVGGGSLFYEDPTEHLKKIERRAKWPSCFKRFYYPKQQQHSKFKFILADRLTRTSAKQCTTKSMMREPTRPCGNGTTTVPGGLQ